MKNIFITIFYLFSIVSCSKMTPGDVALEYQQNKYLNYERSYQFIKKETMPLEVYLKYKNLSFLQLGYFEGSNLFKFKYVSTKIINNKALVKISITRPDFKTLKSNLFFTAIGTSQSVNASEIKKQMKLAKKETIFQTIELEQNKNGTWEVIP